MDERKEVIAGLRELADTLENNSTLPIPSASMREFTAFPETPWDATPEQERAELGRIARALPGKVEKDYSNGSIAIRHVFGGITYEVFASAACTKRQVGTRTVVEEEPVQTRTVTREEPVYEYDCGPILEAVK